MKLARRQRQDRPEPIIALIDVVFFLLVFSLLVGRMDATAPFRVSPATSAFGAEMPGGGETVAIGADGSLAFNGATVDEAALIEALGAILAEEPDRLVRVNAHRDSELGRFLPLVARLEALGARDLVLVVTQDTQ